MLGPVICLSPCEGLVAINPKLTPCAGEPTQRTRRATSRFLFDLAPDGACHAVFLAENPVVSYTAFSPLSRHPPCGVVRTVCFLWRFPFPLIWQRASPDDTGDILPCGVRTFLSGEIRCGIPRSDRTLDPSIYKELVRIYAIRAASTISGCRNCIVSWPGPSWLHAQGAEAASYGNRRRPHNRRWPLSPRGRGRNHPSA